VVVLVRERPLRADVLGLDPYYALMEQYDPGNRAADITPVFTEAEGFLKDFVPQALAVQEGRLAKRVEAAVGQLCDRQTARAWSRHDGGGRVRPHPWLAVGVASSVLRRRAERRAHHYPATRPRISCRR
jgi:carboxypeptidase Taq